MTAMTVEGPNSPVNYLSKGVLFRTGFESTGVEHCFPSPHFIGRYR